MKCRQTPLVGAHQNGSFFFGSAINWCNEDGFKYAGCGCGQAGVIEIGAQAPRYAPASALPISVAWFLLFGAIGKAKKLNRDIP